MFRSRKRPDVRKVNWRTGAVQETSAGMAALRSAAYRRSGGFCECQLEDPSRKCKRRVGWNDGQLHHMKPAVRNRDSARRSDELSRVAFTTRQCHKELTGKLHWTPLLPIEALGKSA